MESRTASPNQPMMLGEGDLPAIYQAADQNSLEAQTKFLRWSGVSLIMLVLAAGAGAYIGDPSLEKLTKVDLMAVGAAAAFGIAMLVRIQLLSTRPERAWYGGRAVAESAKTLAWRYAVGGAPFQIDQSPDEVDQAFCESLEEILTDVDETSLTPPSGVGRQITQRMRDLRIRSLDERKEAYSVGRIDNQMQWYSRKAKRNKVRADRWNFVLMFIEALGLLGAIVAVATDYPIDLLGLAGAVVAAGASWLQTKQHANLAAAYSVAAHELSAINERIPSQRTEENWARFVSEAEDAISREHTLWRASKTMK